MIGAIIGDVVGSVYEWDNIKTTKFPLLSPESKFTDDTVLTIAVADAIINEKDFRLTIKKWGNKYPNAGYGGNFELWLQSATSNPYNSWGNGSAMRVSPVGFYYNTLNEVLKFAKQTAEITHNHPEGIKGAQATASAIFLARMGETKTEIKQYIENNFDYNLSRKVEDIRPSYRFDVSCQGSVPESIISFLESNSYEDAIRLAISFGGDSDTMACITGGIAQAFYKKIDSGLILSVKQRLPLEMQNIIERFEREID